MHKIYIGTVTHVYIYTYVRARLKFVMYVCVCLYLCVFVGVCIHMYRVVGWAMVGRGELGFVMAEEAFRKGLTSSLTLNVTVCV